MLVTGTRWVDSMTNIVKDTKLIFNVCLKYCIARKWTSDKKESAAFKNAYPNWETTWADETKYSTECGCREGFVCVGNVTMPCAAGHWCESNTTTPADQRPCPNGKYGYPLLAGTGYDSEENACGLCEPGRYGNGTGRVGREVGCPLCPSGRASAFGAPGCYLICTH